MCVLDCLCLPQQGYPAPGRHGTMGVTWQATVTRTRRVHWHQGHSLYSIHLCPSFLPLRWLNSNMGPPHPPPRNLLETRNVGSPGIFVNGRGFRGISEKPCLPFHILERDPKMSSSSLFFWHRDSTPKLRNIPSGGPQLLPVGRENSAGWCDVPLSCPFGHEGNHLRRAQCLCGAWFLRMGLILCGPGRIPPSLS